MRKAVSFLVLAMFATFICGCNSGGGPTAEDTAFEKQLADAAAKNQAKPGEDKHTMKSSKADLNPQTLASHPAAGPGPTAPAGDGRKSH